MDYGLQCVGLKRYSHDFEVKWLSNRPPPEAGKRGKVTELSPRSYPDFCFLLNNIAEIFRYMVSFSYHQYFPYTVEEKTAHMNWIATTLRRCGALNYIWVMEFQERGVPHFHWITDFFLGFASELKAKWSDFVYRRVCERPEHYFYIDSDRIVRNVVLPVEFSMNHQSYGVDIQKRTHSFRHYLLEHTAKRHQKSLPIWAEDGLGRWFGWSRGIRQWILAPEVLILTPEGQKFIDIHISSKYIQGSDNPLVEGVHYITFPEYDSQIEKSKENSQKIYKLR